MFYSLSHFLFGLLFQYVCRWKVEGKENLPPEGPVVVICNHVSYWDPIVLGVALDRPVCFMAKEELFRIPVLSQIIRLWGAFPVKRNVSDMAAVKKGLEVLKKGGVLGIFPEGTRSRNGKLMNFHSGGVLLAARAGAPVLPVAVIGTRGIFAKGWFHSFTVRIGKPLKTNSGDGEKPRREDLEAVNLTAWKAVANLLETENQLEDRTARGEY